MSGNYILLVKTVTTVARLREWGNRCHLLFKQSQGHVSEEHVACKILLWQKGEKHWQEAEEFVN